MSSAFAQTYDFRTINYPNDTFTQLLSISNTDEIAGDHDATVNKGFTYSLKTGKFTDLNYPGSQRTQVIGSNNDPFKVSGFYISMARRWASRITNEASRTWPFRRSRLTNSSARTTTVKRRDTTAPRRAAAVARRYTFLTQFGEVFEAFTIGVRSAQATGINNSSDVCGFYVDANKVNHGWPRILVHFLCSRISGIDLYPGSRLEQQRPSGWRLD